MSCKIYARNHTSIVYLPWSSSSKLETELHCQHIPISSFTRPKSHNFNTTRICVGLKSSAVFKICEQQSSANVLFNLQPKVYCMQSVICTLQYAVCSLQMSDTGHDLPPPLQTGINAVDLSASDLFSQTFQLSISSRTKVPKQGETS